MLRILDGYIYFFAMLIMGLRRIIITRDDICIDNNKKRTI